MATTQVRIPKLCKDKATGQAVVRLDGNDHYLGKFGTDAAKAAYERLIVEWLAHGRRLPDARSGPSINELILGYWRRSQEHYRKADVSPSSELDLTPSPSIPKASLRPHPKREIRAACAQGRASADDRHRPVEWRHQRARQWSKRLCMQLIGRSE